VQAQRVEALRVRRHVVAARRGFDVAHVQRIVGGIEKKERPAGFAIVAPELRGAFPAGEGGCAELHAQIHIG